jgi:predicted membrane protein
MPARDLLRKGLDKFEGNREQSDQEFAELFIKHVDALSNRRKLKLHLAIVGSTTFLVWLSVIIFPRDVARAWEVVSELNNKITAVLIAMLFGLGFWFTYALFRLKFPDLEDKRFDGEILGSFHASEHSLKRYRVWLAATVGGILNVLILVAMDIYLVAGR